MQRKLLSLVLCLTLVILVGCAAQWELLTPDQKARATTDMIQIQLEETFDQAKAYIDVHPEHLEVWKAEIVPAFDLANKALKDVIELAQMEEITPAEVRARVNPLVNRVIIFLHKIGFI